MTIADIRDLLGLGPEVSDADVILAYGDYLAEQPVAVSPATLRIRYPEFTGVADPVIQYWLDDALRIVTVAWGSDAVPGQLALAAHNMADNDVPGIAKSKTDRLPAGVTKFKSAGVDVSVSEAAANRSITGGYGSTRYGREFQIMLRRNCGGPFLAGCA